MSKKVQAEVLALLGEMGVSRALPGSAFRMDALIAVDMQQLRTLLLDYRELKRRHSPPPLPPADPTDDLQEYLRALDPPPYHGPPRK